MTTRTKKSKNSIAIKSIGARSFTTIENYVIELPHLNPSARSILNVFMKYQNCNETFIGYSKLLRYTGIRSTTSITKWLRFLEWIGFISIDRCYDDNGVLFNLYVLHHDKIRSLYDYLIEVNLTFLEIEDYWNKKASTPKKATMLLDDKHSFIEALKDILSTK